MRKFKILISIALILGICLFIINLNLNSKLSEEKCVIQAFSNSYAQILTSRFYCKALLKGNSFDMEELKNATQKTLEYFDIKDNTIKKERKFNDEYMEFRIFAQTKDNKNVTLTASSNKLIDCNQGENYLVIEIIQDEVYDNLKIIKQEIEKFIKPYCMEINTEISVVGTYVGRLHKQQVNNIINNIVEGYGAKNIHYTENDNAIKISAYIPFHGELMPSQSKDVNFEIFMKYSSYEDKTYITITSPFVIMATTEG